MTIYKVTYVYSLTQALCFAIALQIVAAYFSMFTKCWLYSFWEFLMAVQIFYDNDM